MFTTFFAHRAFTVALEGRYTTDGVPVEGYDILGSLLLPIIVLALLIGLPIYLSHPVVLARKAGIRSVDRSQAPQLHNVIDEICVAAGLPKPQVALIDDPALNAFSLAGRTPDRNVIAFTTGLLAALSRDELQGVAAHELAQAANRSEDYLYADATAVRLTRNPAGLRGALEKMAAGSTIVHRSPARLRHQWLDYPDERSTVDEATDEAVRHPPLRERIRALTEMETLHPVDRTDRLLNKANRAAQRALLTLAYLSWVAVVALWAYMRLVL